MKVRVSFVNCHDRTIPPVSRLFNDRLEIRIHDLLLRAGPEDDCAIQKKGEYDSFLHTAAQLL